jgi:hypothetical protein
MKQILFLFLLFSLFFSFSPKPTPYNLIEICESTGGELIETFQEIDCGPDCRAMPMTHSDCMCPDGITYMNIDYMYNFQGCTGDLPVCFDDYGCARTGQGNLCNEDGICVFDNTVSLTPTVCLSIFLFLILLVVFVNFTKV